MLKIADGGPSLEAMESNAHGLAAYAKIAQVSLVNLELVCSSWIALEQTHVKRSSSTYKRFGDVELTLKSQGPSLKPKPFSFAAQAEEQVMAVFLMFFFGPCQASILADTMCAQLAPQLRGCMVIHYGGTICWYNLLVQYSGKVGWYNMVVQTVGQL